MSLRVRFWIVAIVPLLLAVFLITWLFSTNMLYNRAWRFASIDALLATVESAFVSVLLTIAFTYMFNMHFPRSVYILFFVLTVVSLALRACFIVSLQIVLG